MNLSRALRVSLLACLALTLAGSPAALGSTRLGPVSVKAPRHPSVRQKKITISFAPRGSLPAGGYYFAVLVLENYRRASQAHPPSCAVSSNMKLVQYGYPHGGRVTLTLPPASSRSGRWCAGGTYAGAVYAVPHKPPCTGSHPCYGQTAETVGPYGASKGACWELGGEHVVCGVPAYPSERERIEREAREKSEREAREKAEREAAGRAEGEAQERTRREAREKAEREARESQPYSFPGGLPAPLDPGIRRVGTFKVSF